MITTYIPPSRWWRRKHSIQLAVWPEWLARLLCRHDYTHVVAWGDAENDEINACQDCGAWFVEKGTHHFDVRVQMQS